MDQHDDGLNTARLQLRDQRIHGVGFVLEFKARSTHGRNDVGRALQRQADKGDWNPVELPDLRRVEISNLYPVLFSTVEAAR